MRRKQACLRVPTLTPEANGDDYYYHLLMLYLPWCNETVDLLDSHATAKQSFVSNNDCLLVLGGDQALFAAEVERATCQLMLMIRIKSCLKNPNIKTNTPKPRMKCDALNSLGICLLFDLEISRQQILSSAVGISLQQPHIHLFSSKTRQAVIFLQNIYKLCNLYII